MTPTETSQLLTIAAVVDNRIVGKETVQVWGEAIGHLDYVDCVDALNMFRRESEKYLMPAHIIANVKRIRDDRREHAHLEQPEGKGSPHPKNLEAWAKAWDSPVEFSRQEAIYHQQCIDEGHNPHVDYQGSFIACTSCAA